MLGSIEEAEIILKNNPEYFMPLQFENPANPDIHRKTTAPEIIETLGPDIDGSGEVNFVDFAMLSSNWADACTEPTWCDGSDFDINGTVDIEDLSKFAASWLD